LAGIRKRSGNFMQPSVSKSMLILAVTLTTSF